MKNRLEGTNTPTFEVFALEIFEKFYNTLPLPYKLMGKVIPFAYINSFFSWFKIRKEEKKLILKVWQEKNLCRIRRFHGISLVENSPEERDRLYFQLREEVQRILEGEKK
ncbi:MAG: hypothetical protein QW228_03080 [Candidatus Aenigmatarchaeota archaeon]